MPNGSSPQTPAMKLSAAAANVTRRAYETRRTRASSRSRTAPNRAHRWRYTISAVAPVAASVGCADGPAARGAGRACVMLGPAAGGRGARSRDLRRGRRGIGGWLVGSQLGVAVALGGLARGCRAGQAAREGQEACVADHLVRRPHALALDVPRPVERLQRLHVAEAVCV